MSLKKSIAICLVVKSKSKRWLAKNLDVHINTLFMWIRENKCPEIRLRQICRLLDVPVEEFKALGKLLDDSSHEN